MRETSWAVKVWGVRGSVPAADAAMLEYGGNTSCVSAEAGGELVVFDAGSGLAALGRSLPRGGGRIHILLSHLHLDHVMGLFGFQPLHDPEMEIHLYGAAGEGGTFRRRLERLVGPPYWPLGLRDFAARIVLHQIGPGERFSLAGGGGPAVETMAGRHPNGSLLYRLEAGGRSVVHALDCELDGEIEKDLVDFARDADLLIWDAAFAPGDLRPGWGHSTWEQGAALGRAAGVKTALMTHYSWEYTDEFLREQERLAAKAGGAVRFAREGMEIWL